MATPSIRYAKTVDGLHIAYQVVGDGPFDLVYAPGWFSNLECVWEMPDLGAFLTELATFSRLILFDRRGFGLSDWPTVPPAARVCGKSRLSGGVDPRGYKSSCSDSRAMRQRPSTSRRQTMRKRLRTRGESEPLGPLTQLARPCVAAKSPAPRVESATISIEEITTAGAATRRASRPSIGGIPGPTKIASSV